MLYTIPTHINKHVNSFLVKFATPLLRYKTFILLLKIKLFRAHRTRTLGTVSIRLLSFSGDGKCVKVRNASFFMFFCCVFFKYFHTLKLNKFIELMETATPLVVFSLNNEMYQQKDGVAMGSPLGPALANIYFALVKSNCLTATK